jgi:hypothetical protein
MKVIQKIGVTEGPATGPMQSEGDWPGVFIRGDDALCYAIALTKLTEKLGAVGQQDPDLLVRHDIIPDASYLITLADLLKSCRVSERGS